MNEPDADEPFVRPYMITAGRTVGAAGDMPIETMVVARRPGEGLDDDLAAVVELCTEMLSVAEIGALLSLPVGVARVLVADLAASGHLERFQTAAVEDATIVRRLLDGIRAL